MKYLSFPVAIAIHLIAFLLVAIFHDTNTETQFTETRNFIDMNFSTGAVDSSGGKPKAKTTNNIEINSGSSSAGSTGTTPGAVASGSGEGAGFESSVTYYKDPVYPKMAIRRGIEGKVLVRLKISNEGIPLETQIVSTSGHESLDQAAVLATKEWRFQKRSGQEHYFVEKNIIFQLKN
jgi:TonB family protein